MDSTKKIWAALVAVAILAVGGYFFPQAKALFGEIGTRFPNGLMVGPVSATTWSVNAAGVMTVAGAIVQTGGASAVTILPGLVAANNIIQASGGYAQTISTNTTVTVPQWCAGTAILIPQGAPALTITLPAASSTFAAQASGGCGGVAGAWTDQLIDNESSNTVTFATTTGGANMNFYFATGTPAVYPPKLLATSTIRFTGQYPDSTHVNVMLTPFNRPF